MKCEHCGNNITNNSNFCRICGTPVKVNNNDDVNIKAGSHSIELTDNIDVTQIKIAEVKNDINDDVSGDEIKVTKESVDKEFTAMLEITNSDKHPNQNELINNKNGTEKIQYDGIAQEINNINPSIGKDDEMSLNIMPGEVNSIEIQNTEEFDDLLLNDISSSQNKQKEINKMEDSDLNSIIKHKDLEEPTMIIPDELIINSVDNLQVNDEIIKPDKSIEQSDLIGEGNHDEKEDGVNPYLQLETNNVIKDKDTSKVLNEESIDNSVSNTSLNEEKNLQLDTFYTSDKTDVFNNSTKKKKSKIGVIILSILITISIAIISILCCKLIILQDANGSLKNANKSLKEQANKFENENNNQETKSLPDVIKINGYTLNRENNYEYSIENDNLVLLEKNNTIRIKFGLGIGFDQIKEGKDEYKEIIEKNDLTVVSYGTKVSDNLEYVVFEAKSKDNKNYLIAYTKVSETDVVSFVISNSNNEIDYNILSTTNDIIKSIKKYSSEEINTYNLFNTESKES